MKKKVVCFPILQIKTLRSVFIVCSECVRYMLLMIGNGMTYRYSSVITPSTTMMTLMGSGWG